MKFTWVMRSFSYSPELPNVIIVIQALYGLHTNVAVEHIDTISIENSPMNILLRIVLFVVPGVIAENQTSSPIKNGGR